MDPTELINLVKRMRQAQLYHDEYNALERLFFIKKVDAWLSAWDQHEAVRGSLASSTSPPPTDAV